jgi:hypothetical protein
MNRLRRSIRKFHEDEAGMEALQVVMIIAIGAVILLAIVKLWPTVKSWFSEQTSEVIQMKE